MFKWPPAFRSEQKKMKKTNDVGQTRAANRGITNFFDGFIAVSNLDCQPTVLYIKHDHAVS